jgi:1-deoxy-D-xylulose-5-phosphate reductoisomerase
VKEVKRIAILGSTGSIGTQALEVIKAQPDLLQAEVLVAHSNDVLLIQQALEFQPNVVVIADESKYQVVKEALVSTSIKVYAGADAIAQVVQFDTVDMVLTAMVGFAGLLPTIKAIEAKKPIALANKETLVVAGALISKLCIEQRVPIIPVDSEHSAIFQCMVGEWHNPIEKLILTASGGPFRGKNRADLAQITKAQALKHPNWSMGAKITIDSATLMNKGLEVIEARWLFDIPGKDIEVVVHPQSIVHSAVQFSDGSIKAQLGLPDMKLPIVYALAYPNRVESTFKRFQFTDYPNLTFEKPDLETFRNLALAFEALNAGGNQACVLNAANEIAVEAFLQDKISFLGMTDLIEHCLNKVDFIQNPSLSDYLQTDRLTRTIAKERI